MNRVDGRDDELEGLIGQRWARQQAEAGDVCLDPELLASCVDGGLSAAEIVLVETHLSTCADCRATMAMLVDSSAELDASGAVDSVVAPGLAHGLAAAVSATETSRPFAKADREAEGKSVVTSARFGGARQRQPMIVRAARIWLPLAASVIAGAGLYFAFGPSRASISRVASQAEMAAKEEGAAAPLGREASPRAANELAKPSVEPQHSFAEPPQSKNAGAADAAGNAALADRSTADGRLKQRAGQADMKIALGGARPAAPQAPASPATQGQAPSSQFTQAAPAPAQSAPPPQAPAPSPQQAAADSQQQQLAARQQQTPSGQQQTPSGQQSAAGQQAPSGQQSQQQAPADGEQRPTFRTRRNDAPAAQRPAPGARAENAAVPREQEQDKQGKKDKTQPASSDASREQANEEKAAQRAASAPVSPPPPAPPAGAAAPPPVQAPAVAVAAAPSSSGRSGASAAPPPSTQTEAAAAGAASGGKPASAKPVDAVARAVPAPAAPPTAPAAAPSSTEVTVSTPIVPVEAARAAQMNGGDASPGVRESVAVMPVGTVVFRAASGPQRWRIRPPGAIEGSKDAGRSWTVEYNDPQLRLVSGAVTPQNTCWMVGEQGAVLRLRRNQSWERVAAPTSRKLLSVAATDDTSAVVADDQGAMYRTTDGGTTWQPFKP